MSVRPSRWVVRGLLASATVAMVLGWFGLHSLDNKADWLAFYAAGKFLLDGRIHQIYDPQVIQAWQAPIIGDFVIRFLYAPAFSILYLPLALLPLQAARYFWLLIGIGAGVLAARFCTRWSALSFPVSVLSLLAFAPFAYSLAVGQMSPITLLLFVLIAGLEWQERGGYLPGVLAGLALFKPQLLIPLVIFWLFRRRWRSLSGLVVMAVVVAFVSFLVSPHGSLEFLRTSLEFFNLSVAASESGANASFFAISPWIGVLVAIGVLVVLFFTWQRGSNRYSHAMLWLTPVLVSPYIVTYDLLLLFLPATFLVPLLEKDRLLQGGILLLYLTPFLAIPLFTIRPVVWVAFLLFLICAWRVLGPIGLKDASA